MSADPHADLPVRHAGAPLGRGRAVVITVHGRGASPENILQLAAGLDRPAVTYLAPTAAGHTWYPFSFLTPTEQNEPHLSSALRVLERLVANLEERGLDRRRIVLLGFSQGACLSAEFLVRHAGRWGGLVALSGGLIGPPGTRWVHPGNFGRTPMFLGCSDVDAHIPRERVEESARVFESMGASVTMRLYAGMGHIVNEDEIKEARAVIDAACDAVD